jgi:glycosyltransferase involved in cell wall biosynthesis
MRDELTKTILYFENGVGFGGAVISLRTFLDFADKERFRPVLVHSLCDGKFATFSPDVKRIHLPRIALGNNVAGDLLRKANIDICTYAMRLARIANAERADCIYLNNDLVTSLAGTIAGRVLGLPIIQHERDIPAPTSRLATSVSRWATRLLAISSPVRMALEGMGLASERIRMVPEGLDLSLYEEVSEGQVAGVRQELGILPYDKVAVLVGMVMDWKGQHVLINAATHVLRRHPQTRVLIVGEAPPGGERYLRDLTGQVAKLGLERCVVFSGYRSDIPSVLQAADVVVHASTSPEPFGRVVIEGMAMKKPVIATDIGAPPEVIRHGETGFLVKPWDPIVLADAIVTVFDNPRLARQVGEAARRDVVRKYSIQRHVSLIESVFEEVFWRTPPALPAALSV